MPPKKPEIPHDLIALRAALARIADPLTIRGLAHDQAVARLQALAASAIDPTP